VARGGGGAPGVAEYGGRADGGLVSTVTMTPRSMLEIRFDGGVACDEVAE
jgi:hypothetical protein